MECPICFNYIKSSAIGSCYHHFCFKCISNWCLYDNKCPLCKTLINQILYDKEFDNINNKLLYLKNYSDSSNNTDTFNINNDTNNDSNNDTNNHTNNHTNNRDISNILDINICFDDNSDKKFILTLKNNKGPGVYVHKINKNCRAYHYGLRLNDIILFVNNITCISHSQTISIFDNSQLSSTSISCKIIRK